MLKKDFENFELRLKTLREESREDFDRAEKLFDETYKSKLEEIFPRDILGAKKDIAGRFILASADNPGQQDIFQVAVKRTVENLPLSAERKQKLSSRILKHSNSDEVLENHFEKKEDIGRDPFFVLVEEFAIDGKISQEEFLLLQESYSSQGNFLKALESLPENLRDLFHAHIEFTIGDNITEKKREFESEYHSELSNLEKKGINIEPVVVFVSRSFYKTPGKYRKFEHPKRRMIRSFKLALLRLLQVKLGNIDANIMLKKFQEGESFEDFFMLLFKLLEVVNEDPKGEEIYKSLALQEDIASDVFTAEENKQKILAGESLVMSIASLFSKTDSQKDEQELDDGILEKVLDESTDIVGEDIYFNREEENAGIYAEESQLSGEKEEDEEEIDYDTMSPETAYEMLQRDFHKIEEEKRKAFLQGEYDQIDIYNDGLLSIQIKLEKLSRILGGNNVNS